MSFYMWLDKRQASFADWVLLSGTLCGGGGGGGVPGRAQVIVVKLSHMRCGGVTIRGP